MVLCITVKIADMRYNKIYSEAYRCDMRPVFNIVMSYDAIFVGKKHMEDIK